MNTNLTEIAYILDRSGSMGEMEEPAITAFNHFLTDQLDVPGDANLTFVQFDDAYDVDLVSRPIKEAPQLTAATYFPCGSTALLDAFGRTIEDIGRRLQLQTVEKQPGKVIFAIFTDGLENASLQYTAKHIGDLIRLYREEKGWEFLFLAANQDAIASAASMNMGTHDSANVSFDAHGIISIGKAISRKIKASRLFAAGYNDQLTCADVKKSLDDILREEEGAEG